MQLVIQPDDLSTVHLSTIPQKDRTYAMLSKKKKRRSNNKKPKHPPGPHSSSQSNTGRLSVDALTPKFASHSLSCEGSLPKVATCSASVDMPTPEFFVKGTSMEGHSEQVSPFSTHVTTGLSSVDAPTPKFAVQSSLCKSVKKLEKDGLSVNEKTPDFSSRRSIMEDHTPKSEGQLNSALADTCGLPVEEIVPSRAETKGSHFGLSHGSKSLFNDSAQHRNRNFIGHNDDAVMSACVYEKSEAESSGYQSASSQSAASSDSEYSDSEVGQIARLR